MIDTSQAIEAIKTLKEYCNQRIPTYETCECCPLVDWCWYDREHLTPDDWEIPQERTEE
jgi:hypothetical protein